jgi:hypothetical protein
MSDIQRLFDEDPLKLTKPDYAEIVAYYRAARQQFVLGDKKAGKAPKKDNGEKIKNLDDILSDL